jgi:SOS-response transcriptional repressor LexA
MIKYQRRWPTNSAYSPAAILHYIIKYKTAHDGNSPTLREICRDCGVSSTSVADHILRNLESRGKIRLNSEGSRSRQIEVVGGRWTYEEPS